MEGKRKSKTPFFSFDNSSRVVRDKNERGSEKRREPRGTLRVEIVVTSEINIKHRAASKVIRANDSLITRSTRAN